MIVIIKHFKNKLSPVFCAGDVACEKAGELSNTVIEKMKSNNLLHEMDPVKVIDKYFRHAELIFEAKDCTYYELKKVEHHYTEKPLLCDVEGCNKECHTGVCGWREYGYWTLCSDHFSLSLEGGKMPTMKKESIERENNRGSKGT